MESFHIDITWWGAPIEENIGYTYPAKFTKLFRDRYAFPAVYRWRIHPGERGRSEPVYIGEVENLAQRIQRVLTLAKSGSSGEGKKSREGTDPLTECLSALTSTKS